MSGLKYTEGEAPHLTRLDGVIFVLPLYVDLLTPPTLQRRDDDIE